MARKVTANANGVKSMFVDPTSPVYRTIMNDPEFTTYTPIPQKPLNDEKCMEIAKALGENTHLKELHLPGCEITSSTAILFAEALKKNKTLQILDLSHNKIGLEAIEAFGLAIKDNNTLAELNLFGNKEPGETGLQYFIESFDYNTMLKVINWRLTSRKSFAINKCLTRNKEIERLLKNGKPVDNVDPNLRRAKGLQPTEDAKDENANSPKTAPKITEKIASTGGPYTALQLQAAKEFLPSDIDALKKRIICLPMNLNKFFNALWKNLENILLGNKIN